MTVRWIQALFFYHPAIWWIGSAIRTERENCCDDLAADVCGDRRLVAQTLASLEESRVTSAAPVLAARGSRIVSRVRRLLVPAYAPGLGSAVASLALAAGAAALVFFGWQITAAPTESTAPKALWQIAQRKATEPAASPRSSPTSPQRSTLPAQYGKWLDEDVVYIITPEERLAFGEFTTDESRNAFIDGFWKRRGDGAREEHYRRIRYVNERFPSRVPGWRTDRGRIYLTLGPPRESESHPKGQNGSPPYEIWRYAPVGATEPRYFTFVDVDNSGHYRLEPPKPAKPQAANKLVGVTALDSQGRLVTGLEMEHFRITEHGTSRAITYFQPAAVTTAIAVVSPEELELPGSLTSTTFVVQTRNVDEAVTRLLQVDAARRVLIVREGIESATKAVSENIATRIVERSAIGRSAVESLNQYMIGYRSEAAVDPVSEIRTPKGLPPLTTGRVIR